MNRGGIRYMASHSNGSFARKEGRGRGGEGFFRKYRSLFLEREGNKVRFVRVVGRRGMGWDGTVGGRGGGGRDLEWRGLWGKRRGREREGEGEMGGFGGEEKG